MSLSLAIIYGVTLIIAVGYLLYKIGLRSIEIDTMKLWMEAHTKYTTLLEMRVKEYEADYKAFKFGANDQLHGLRRYVDDIPGLIRDVNHLEHSSKVMLQMINKLANIADAETRQRCLDLALSINQTKLEELSKRLESELADMKKDENI